MVGVVIYVVNIIYELGCCRVLFSKRFIKIKILLDWATKRPSPIVSVYLAVHLDMFQCRLAKQPNDLSRRRVISVSHLLGWRLRAKPLPIEHWTQRINPALVNLSFIFVPCHWNPRKRANIILHFAEWDSDSRYLDYLLLTPS